VKTIAAFLLIAAFALPAVAGQAAGTDAQVQMRVEQLLAQKKARGIKVMVTSGSVALAGKINSIGAKQDLVADLVKVEGVKEVVTTDLQISKAESDQKLAERVADQVRRSTYFTVFDDIEIGADNGVVTLTGYVTQPIKAEDMAKRASHVDGAQDFVNHIEVLPVSINDDRIRNVVANAIYRDPTFSNYASQAIPPIHIVVRNSSVLLTGVVNSEVERRKAETIVRSIPGILGVQNALQIER
jgi:osmotically-inducible protein OsmY